MSAGKGDKYRPVNRKVFNENFDRIFRKETARAQRRQRLPETGGGSGRDHGVGSSAEATEVVGQDGAAPDASSQHPT